MPRRVAALLDLLCLVVGVAALVVAALRELTSGLLSLLLLAAAAVVAWQGLIRGGRVRSVALIGAGGMAAAAVLLLVHDGVEPTAVAGALLIGACVALTRHVFSPHVHLPTATPPVRPALIFNPRSGGGKAARFHLADEAANRGIEAIELRPGDDLVELVHDAVARGADGLMAAGGDGTQALVATIAAEHDLPFACVPAGTRNHFALDLGVDRTDVVGALDAFVDGGERRVDLAEVNGRVFVNNVSLGLYATAVQHEGYRDAKVRTLLDTVPTIMGPDATSTTQELSWTGPDGTPQRQAAVILVANNAYRLGRVIAPGTRPRLDTGQLGVTVVGSPDLAGQHRIGSEWTTPEFVVDADGEVPVGVDGEALTMPGPLVFRSRPAALRVRIARQHPGASPSVAMPTGVRDGVRRLLAVAGGADPLEL